MKNIIDKTYNYIFLLFCFVLPFSGLIKAAPNILIIVLVILFPFHSLKNNIKSIKKELIVTLVFISIIVLNTLLFKRWEDFGIISRLFYIPIILVLFCPVKNTKSILLCFISGAFLILSASSIRMLNNNFFELTNGEKVNEFLLGERPYLGFIYLISACFSAYLGLHSEKTKYKVFFSLLALVFVCFIFLIAARLSVLSVLLSLILALFYFFKKVKNNMIWLLIIPSFIILFFSFSNNLSKRFYINDEYSSFITSEPRYYIWNCAYDIFPKNPIEFIFGKGYYQTENALGECYKSKNNFIDAEHKRWFVDAKFNTHNQFLDFFLSQGITSIILTLLSFLYLVFKNKKTFFGLSLILFVFLFFCFENVLTRQLGCMLVGLVLSFVLYSKAKATM